jgi:hypothetical protein
MICEQSHSKPQQVILLAAWKLYFILVIQTLDESLVMTAVSCGEKKKERMLKARFHRTERLTEQVAEAAQ